jgi:hypothetical protein
MRNKRNKIANEFAVTAHTVKKVTAGRLPSKILKEVAKAYADCGRLGKQVERSERSESDECRFAQLYNEALAQRNLGFRASQAVTPKVAAAIMSRIVPAYNDFRADLLLLLPDDCEVVIARENSVCIYVKPGKTKLPSRKKLKADEYGVLNKTEYDNDEFHSGGTHYKKTPYGGYKGEVRIWWD